MPTNKPVPSDDPSDLIYNARRVDEFSTSDNHTYTDRLGKTRLTRTGIESVARIDIASAVAAATAEANQARDDAQAAAGSIGPLKFYDTYAKAMGDAANWPTNGLVEVSRDETLGGARTRYEPNEGELVFVVNLDQVRIDLSSTDSGAGLISTAVAEYQQHFTQFSSIQEMSLAPLPLWTKANVRGTTYQISPAPAQTCGYPLLPAAHGFAVPVKDHLVKRYGAIAGRGELTGAEWLLPNGKSLQGIEIDNRAGTIIVSSLNTAVSPQTGVLIEYAFNEYGVGAEVLRTGTLPLGHCEYFSIVYDENGDRFVWASGDDGIKVIRKIPFRTGASGADVVQTVDVAVATGLSTTINVFSYDASHLAIWGVGEASGDSVHICNISDLDAGVFSPVKSVPVEDVGRIWSLYPGQMLRSMGGEWAGLSGGIADQIGNSTAGWYSEDTGVIRKIPISFANGSPSEVEGVAFYWNANSSKFETIIAIWYQNEGRIGLHSLTAPDGVVSTRQTDSTFYKEFYSGAGANQIPSQFVGQGVRYYSPAPVAACSLHIGGDRRQNGRIYEPSDFYIAQWNHISEGRESAVIRFKGIEFRIDGPNYSVIGPSYRFILANTEGVQKEAFQVMPFGIKVGNSRLNNSASPKCAADFRPVDDVDIGVYVATPQTGRPSFVGSSVGMTFATTYSDIYFGQYSIDSKVSTVWWYMNGSRLRPAVDNSVSIGTSGQRIKDMYLTNNPIVTSDEREKSDPVDISDDVLDAWGGVQFVVFQWLHAIELKGVDYARWHFGVIAQAVRDSFAAHGIDACRFGLLCYDQWEDEWRTIPAVVKEYPAEYSQSLVDLDGGPLLLKEASSLVVEAERQELVHSAGNRWGIRADQCFFLEAAWQRRELRRLQEMIARAGIL